MIIIIIIIIIIKKTIEMSYWHDKISFRTAPPTEICCYILKYILDFRRHLSSYLKFGPRLEDFSRFCL